MLPGVTRYPMGGRIINTRSISEQPVSASHHPPEFEQQHVEKNTHHPLWFGENWLLPFWTPLGAFYAPVGAQRCARRGQSRIPSIETVVKFSPPPFLPQLL